MKKMGEYLYKTVRVETKDGRILKGDVISIESSIESESGYAEMGIDYGSYIEGVDESEIKSIEVLDG